MYYKLVENYRRKCSRLQTWENPMNFIDENNRHFHCEHFKIFAYICDCIACHNIWKAPMGKEELYKKYKLEPLIGENFKIVSYKDNPLLFILCLADSIEPTKKINDMDELEVLRNIEFEYCVEVNRLIISIKKELNTNYKCREYIENLKNIESWIDIKVAVKLV
jgi:hypothetical protein